MDIEKEYEKMRAEIRAEIKRFNDLPKEQRESINKKKEILSQKIKDMLDNIDYSITYIDTSYKDNYLLKDGTLIKAYKTMFISYDTLFTIYVITNAETMKMLYVQTRPMKYMSINEFFKLGEE